MSVHAILLILALVCFVLAALNVTVKKISLQSLGLAFLTLAFLLGTMNLQLG